MKKTALLFFLFLVILFNNSILSQPSGTVQFIGGYSLPLGDLKGSFGETFNTWTGNGNPDSNTFFMKSGINYGIFVKFPVKKKSKINIIGGVAFNVFSNSISYNDSGGTADYDLTHSTVGITIGGEYSFYSKKSRIFPFIGAEFMFNIYGGKLTITTPSETREFSMNSTLRYGFQFGGGFDYAFHNNLGLTFGVKYAMPNLIGKEFNDDIGTKYNLNDGEHATNGVTYPAKKSSYIQFYGGLSFYFGR